MDECLVIPKTRRDIAKIFKGVSIDSTFSSLSKGKRRMGIFLNSERKEKFVTVYATKDTREFKEEQEIN